jgi:regulator of sigma E protease
LNWQLLLVILEVAVGLGMVIFVHELGHFVVAKLCGVKCEKFYLGFDIYGLKLAKFQWGETQYGIGILPLGGYVKMLGQDDNPAKAAEERERSRLAADPNSPAAPLGDPTETQQLDPRSYMAKSVPQRMAIISAGVIMNLIFACLMGAVAYGLGVKDLACGISAVFPGEAAWRANLQPGDMFVQIGDSGNRTLRFRDLMNAVALCDMEKGIDFQVKRPGVDELFWVNVKPDLDQRRMRPTIGVVQPLTTKLSETKPAIDYTPAEKVAAFKSGDQIVMIGDASMQCFADIDQQLARHSGETLRFRVERQSQGTGSKEAQAGELVDIEVPPRPMRTFGLVMKMGKITAIQADSPAAKADLRAGDRISAIDGNGPGDPLRLPAALRRRAGQTITLSIARQGSGGQDETLEKQITLRDPVSSDESQAPGSALAVPALGITYRVLNVVQGTEKGSPAAGATLTQDGKPAGESSLAPGDEIVRAEFTFPTNLKEPEDGKAVLSPDAVEFGADAPNWPFFMYQMQWMPPGTEITFTLKDQRKTTLEVVDAEDWYFANRGLIPAMEFTTARAHSVGEALVMGGQETVEAAAGVYGFLRKIGTQVSPYMLGGPKTIAEAAGSAAYRGIADLLIFLTMLSANLAVINFLPIPLLDGGHMVFLLLEGIFRRPVSEKVIVAFHYLGFVFIISLMLFVLGLDFGLIPRPH